MDKPRGVNMKDCNTCKYKGADTFKGKVWGYTRCLHPKANTADVYGHPCNKRCNIMRSCLFFGCARGRLWEREDV